jgi:hypothetical protein
MADGGDILASPSSNIFYSKNVQMLKSFCGQIKVFVTIEAFRILSFSNMESDRSVYFLYDTISH